MNKALRRTSVRWIALIFSICNFARAAESEDPLKKALADTTSIQMELAMAQKRFSIMSRALPDPERCVARELLDTSIGYREIATEPFLVGQLVKDMKSVEDQNTVRGRLGSIAYRIIGIGENDIGIVNESLKDLTTPAMIAEATLIRDKMVELRGLWAPISSGHF
jgi:hypothetical protein